MEMKSVECKCGASWDLYHSDDEFKKDNIWWWGLWRVRREEMCVLWWNLREREHLVEIIIDGRRTLKLIFKIIECGGVFSWTAKYFSLCISFSTAEIHLKRHSLCPRKRFKQIKFGNDQSVIKSKVLKNRVTVRLYLNFNWSYFPETIHFLISTHVLHTK